MPDVVNTLIRRQQARVTVLETPDRWFGMTYPEDREPVAASIRERVRQGEYPSRLWPAD